MQKKDMWAILSAEDPQLDYPYPLGGGLVLLSCEDIATKWRDVHTTKAKREAWKPYPVQIIFEDEEGDK